MLFMVGPLVLETYGLEVAEFEEEVAADFAEHQLVGRRVDLEFSGPGEEKLELSGEVLPFHLGGLPLFSLAKSLVRAGTPQFVMRGDGEVYGWYVLKNARGRHRIISPSGVGFVVQHSLTLRRVDDPGEDLGASLIGSILSLFG